MVHAQADAVRRHTDSLNAGGCAFLRRTDDGSAHHTQHALLQTAVRRTLTHINTHTTRYPNKPRLVTREDSSPTPPTFSAGETKPNGYTSCQSAAQLKPHEQVQTARIARQLRTETPQTIYLSIYMRCAQDREGRTVTCSISATTPPQTATRQSRQHTNQHDMHKKCTTWVSLCLHRR